MLVVRRNTFETNSSSTHSLVMCSKDEYDLLEKNEAFLMDDTVILKENLFKDFLEQKQWKRDKWLKYCQENNKNIESVDDLAEAIINNDLFDPYEICTLDKYWDYYSEQFETFDESYTTKSGDTVVAFGYYGMDC